MEDRRKKVSTQGSMTSLLFSRVEGRGGTHDLRVPVAVVVTAAAPPAMVETLREQKEREEEEERGSASGEGSSSQFGGHERKEGS